MPISWKDPKVEMPPNGKLIAVLLDSAEFSPSRWPSTFEIAFGRTFYRIMYGKKTLFMDSNFIGDLDILENAVAWAFASDIEKPEFIRERKRCH